MSKQIIPLIRNRFIGLATGLLPILFINPAHALSSIPIAAPDDPQIVWTTGPITVAQEAGGRSNVSISSIPLSRRNLAQLDRAKKDGLYYYQTGIESKDLKDVRELLSQYSEGNIPLSTEQTLDYLYKLPMVP